MISARTLRGKSCREEWGRSSNVRQRALTCVPDDGRPPVRPPRDIWSTDASIVVARNGGGFGFERDKSKTDWFCRSIGRRPIAAFRSGGPRKESKRPRVENTELEIRSQARIDTSRKCSGFLISAVYDCLLHQRVAEYALHFFCRKMWASPRTSRLNESYGSAARE